MTTQPTPPFKREVFFTDEPPVDVPVTKPNVTTLTIKNPMRQKAWAALLKDNEGYVRKNIRDWADAWMKQLLPANVYADLHSNEDARERQALHWMQQHGTGLENPDGRSLQRNIWHNGRVVAVFNIEIQDTL